MVVKTCPDCGIELREGIAANGMRARWDSERKVSVCEACHDAARADDCANKQRGGNDGQSHGSSGRD